MHKNEAPPTVPNHQSCWNTDELLAVSIHADNRPEQKAELQAEMDRALRKLNPTPVE
jgi:hypothetical protein